MPSLDGLAVVDPPAGGSTGTEAGTSGSPRDPQSMVPGCLRHPGDAQVGVWLHRRWAAFSSWLTATSCFQALRAARGTAFAGADVAASWDVSRQACRDSRAPWPLC
jgi:hypothetical protein